MAPGWLAGSSTDAALGLGAFAVFNQIISGTGIFGRPTPVVHQAVVMAPPPPVIVVPPPVAVYRVPASVYYWTYVRYVPAYPVWAQPGHAKHGRWHRHGWHNDDD
jgi:hypothetical protein